MKKYVMIEAVSTFRMRYLVKADSSLAKLPVGKQLAFDDFSEFSQEHLGEVVVSTREVGKKEALKQFREDNKYLASWTDEQILSRFESTITVQDDFFNETQNR